LFLCNRFLEDFGSITNPCPIPFTQTQGDYHGKEATGKIQHRTDDRSNLYRLDIAGSPETYAQPTLGGNFMIEFILLLILLQLCWLCATIDCVFAYAVIIFVVFKFAGWIRS